MVKKEKIPKYKVGDILKWTHWDGSMEDIVILLRRYDRRPSERIAWWVTSHPKRGMEIGVPEDELTPLHPGEI